MTRSHYISSCFMCFMMGVLTPCIGYYIHHIGIDEVSILGIVLIIMMALSTTMTLLLWNRSNLRRQIEEAEQRGADTGSQTAVKEA